MPDPTLAEIDAALKVCERATVGPWRVDPRMQLNENYTAATGPWHLTAGRECLGVKEAENDAEFIALARDLLPRALRALRERHEDAERLDGGLLDYLESQGVVSIYLADRQINPGSMSLRAAIAEDRAKEGK